MRPYEIMVILDPTLDERTVEPSLEAFLNVIRSDGGKVDKVDIWGRRRLAYTVRKFNDGFYVLLTVAAPGSLIAEIERRLRVSEPVIKFITVRMDEEEKRLAKVKALRDSKVKRSAQPMAPAQHAPATEAPAAETEEEKKPAAAVPAEHAPVETAATAV